MSSTAPRATAPPPKPLAAVIARWCTTCAVETMFEQPVCEEDHGSDCPEWSCVECGEALLLGFDLTEGTRVGAAHRVA